MCHKYTETWRLQSMENPVVKFEVEVPKLAFLHT